MSITIEKLRADIAALLHEAPEDVGLDDNLVDLGLDSMRLMSLTLQWKEEGIPLDFAALAERDTLAGWWEVIAARLDARSAEPSADKPAVRLAD